ncbi:hypothetical protein GCM10007342_11670 [Staphylococcus pragensis]|nr:hypothetical protein GCM10007342_11670 [Staphylococcus pragensis]
MGIFYIRVLKNLGKVLRDNLENPSLKRVLTQFRVGAFWLDFFV